MTREEKRYHLEKRLADILTSPEGRELHKTWADDMQVFDFGTELGDPGMCIVRREKRLAKPGELIYSFTWLYPHSFGGVDAYLEQIAQAEPA